MAAANENMDDIINSFKRKIEKLETINGKLRTENQSLATKAREADNRYGANTQETQMLKSEIENLRDIIKKADEERDKLRKRVTELSKLTRMDSEDKDREIVQLKDKVAAMERVVQKSGHEIKDLSGKIPILVQEKKDLREEIERLKQEKAAYERDIQVMQDQAQNTELKLKLKSEEYESLRYELEDLQAQNNTDERLQTIDTLERLNHKLKLEIQSQRQSSVAAERRLKEMEEQATVLRDDLEDQVEELEKVMLDMAKHKENNVRLESENAILMNESEELRDQIRSMVDNKVELAIVKDQQRRMEEDNLGMARKIVALTERLGTMEETAKSLMLMTKEKQRHNEEFLNEINKLKAENEGLERQVEAKVSSKKKVVKYEDLEIELPLKSDKMGEKELKASIRRLQDENRRLRTMVAMKNMSEQNNITQVTTLQEELTQKAEELDKVHARHGRLEAWMDEIFNNKKYQLILQDEYNRAGGGMPQALPDIPKNPSLVGSPRHTSHDDDLSQFGETPRTHTNAFSSLGRSVAPTRATTYKNSQKPPQTAYSQATNRGRLTGAYSRLR